VGCLIRGVGRAAPCAAHVISEASLIGVGIIRIVIMNAAMMMMW
jgi:hypothetical protein